MNRDEIIKQIERFARAIEQAAMEKLKGQSKPYALEVSDDGGDSFELVYPAAVTKYKMFPPERVTRLLYEHPDPRIAELEQNLDACASECLGLRQLATDLEQKNQNLFNALMASTQQKDNLYKSIKDAVGHLNLYGLFNCVEGDSYDPECADKNVRKALSILKSELTTDIIKPAGKEDQAVCDSVLKEQYK